MDNILIYIDTRENALYDDIIDRDLDIYKDKINIVKETICIGDIHIKFNNNIYIFERKTVKDLISSIHDGRYREQKARMLSTYNQRYLSYIIEDDDIISSKVYSKNKSTIQGAYINTLFRDNIRILFTKNISETVTLILSIAIKMVDNPKKFINISNEVNNTTIDSSLMSQSSKDALGYTDFIKLKKKKIDNIDINTCYIMQLSQIPHISNVIAKNISKIYPNMIELITKLNNCEDKNKELCKIDGIGKEKANTIIKYLFC